MTVSDSTGARHTGEPDSPKTRLHPLIVLAGTLLVLAAPAGAIYLIWPAAGFWVGLGYGIVAPIVIAAVGQIRDQRAKRRGD